MKFSILFILAACTPKARPDLTTDANTGNTGTNTVMNPAASGMLPPGMTAGSATAMVSWMVLAYRNPAMISPENPRGLLGAASTFSAFIFTMAKQEALANYFPALLGGVATAFYFPITPTPEELYNKIWGYIQNQVSATVMFKSKAQLVQSMISLTENLNQQISGYLAELQLLNQTPESIKDLLDKNGGVLNATRDSVDVSMKAIDTILASSFDWFNPISIDYRKPSAFILGSTIKGACLHTKEFNIRDGTDVVFDNECDLNNLVDKTWTMDKKNRLLLRTTLGLKCVTYNDKSGQNMRKHLAIFDINSVQCKNGKKITLEQKSNGDYSIYDGKANMICITSSKASKNANALVTRQKGNQCRDNNLLVFNTVIPIPLDETGTNLEPARSFEEIGIQLFYFSKIASIHLLALKELYNFGTLQRQAEYQFNAKVAEYKKWLEAVLPMYASYATLMNINSTAPIAEATVFYKSLASANLKVSPMFWTIGVDRSSKNLTTAELI